MIWEFLTIHTGNFFPSICVQRPHKDTKKGGQGIRKALSSSHTEEFTPDKLSLSHTLASNKDKRYDFLQMVFPLSLEFVFLRMTFYIVENFYDVIYIRENGKLQN